MESRASGVRKEKRRMLMNFIYIALTIVALVLFGLLDKDVNLNDVSTIFHMLDKRYLLIAVAAMLLHWVLDSFVMHYIVGFVQKGMTRLKAFKLAMIGFYYSALTPFSSGGQPVQVVYMRGDGIPVGKSSCVFCIKFLSFQCTVLLFFLASVLLRGTEFLANTQVFWFTIIGFTVNLLLTLFLVTVMLNKLPIGIWVLQLIRFLHRIKIIRNPEKISESVIQSFSDFHESVKYLKSNKSLLLGSIGLSMIQMFIYFSITYFIYLAFGMRGQSLVSILAVQSFHYLAVCFVPIPGAAIASEFGFYLFFQAFFPANIMYFAMLTWRLFTYYSNIVFGVFFVLGDSIMRVFRGRQMPV